MSMFPAGELRGLESDPNPVPEGPAARRPPEAAEARSAPGYARILLLLAVQSLEFLMIAGCGLAIYEAHVVQQIGPQPLYYSVTMAVAFLDVFIFHLLHSYSVPALRRPINQLFRMSGAWTITFAALIALVFFAKLDSVISRFWLGGWFFLGFNVLAIWRFGLAHIVDKLAASGRFQKRIVVVGGGDFGRDLIRDLAKADPAEFKLLGVFDDRGDARSPMTVEGFAKLGNVDDLVEFARVAPIDLAVFALPITAEQRILQMLSKLWVLPIDVRLAAHANRIRFRPRSYSYLGAAPMLDVFDKPLGDRDVLVKLVFDRVIGVMALIAISPVLLLTALAIRLDSKGPILFKQKRYGFNNELVEVYKFRSMYADKLDAMASKLVTRDDPRVTRVGRFIRKTSIDELPQLFNVVLKGDLSLVGPRPHAIHAKAADRQYDEVVEGYFARHRVKPGITGWAQIHGWRGETDTQEKIQARVDHDLYYIENWSLWLDLYILAVTPLSLVKSQNAY
jgi:Undecaprenyl-phosphate glucose phosphotransferase